MKERARQLFTLAILLGPLIPLHSPPISGFHIEWVVAMVCGLSLVVVSGPLRLPSVPPALLWMLAIVAAAAVLQGVAGRGLNPQITLVPLYCLFGAIVYLFVRGELAAGGRFDERIAAAVVLSGLLACLPASLQLNRVDIGFLFVMPRLGTSVYGNLSQGNHFADWLWLSVLAVALMAARRRIGMGIAVSAICVLVFFSLLTASRSVWLYALLPIMAVLVIPTDSAEEAELRRFRRVIFAAGGALVAIHLILEGVGAYSFFDLISSGQRISEGGRSGDLRVKIWLAALDMIRMSPWIGVGPGGFAWASLQTVALHGGDGSRQVSENAHNLLLHISAEFGVPIGLAVVALAVWWSSKCLRRRLGLRGLWGILSLATIGVHSMLEYPLWYVHFMVLAATYFAICDADLNDRVRVVRVPANTFRVAGVVVLAVLVALYGQYRPTEWVIKQMGWQIKMGLLPFLSPEMKNQLDSVPLWSPLRNYGEATAVVGALPQSRGDAAAWGRRCLGIVSFSPVPVTLGRCTVILSVAGQHSDSDRFAQLGCYAYSGTNDAFRALVADFSELLKAPRTPRASCLSPITVPKI